MPSCRPPRPTGWCARDLTARIPEFIALAEARLNRVLRRLAEMDKALTATIGVAHHRAPGAYSEALALWITPPAPPTGTNCSLSTRRR
jgi:hypothetical protein